MDAPLPSQSPDFDLLLAHLCAGDLSADQAAMLTARLEQDDRACEDFIRYMTLHAELMWRNRGVEDAPVAEPEVALAPSPSRRRIPASVRIIAWAACLALIGYFVGMAVYVSLPKAVRPTGFVATITASEDAQWDLDSGLNVESSTPGSTIPPSEPLALVSGTVALKLKQGVQLVVEGPAEWSIDDENRATLTRGKLVATVPYDAIGFTLKTPAAQIVDLGTEFGVQVDSRGNADVQVLVGEVEVDWNHAQQVRSSSTRLTQGQAVTVNRESGIAPAQFNPGKFITKIDDDSKVVTQTPDQLAGLRLWLRADRGVQLDASGRVQRWADQSGNGFDAIQAVAANRPSFDSTADHGGRPTIAFDGVDDFLLGEKSLGIDGGRNSTIALVMNVPPSNTFYGGVFSLRSHHESDWNSPDGLTIALSRRKGAREICLHQNMRGDRITRPGADPILMEYAVASNGYSSVVVTKYQGVVSLRIDGQTLGFDEFDFSAARPETGAWDNGYCLGARSGNDQPPSGYGQCGKAEISEVLVFDHALQGKEGQALSDYLQQQRNTFNSETGSQ